MALSAATAGHPVGAASQGRLRAQLGALEAARHLQVLLVEGGGECELSGSRTAPNAAPPWFVRLVEPGTTELRRPFHGGLRGDIEIVVRADPADQIAESWEDARPLLPLVLVVSIIANGLSYVVIGRWLKPVERIVAAMDGIEQGDYRARLPAFELPELATVAGKFNRMAEVLERSRSRGGDSPLQELSTREFEIFCLLAEGSSSAEIAKRLSLSRKTVANYGTQLKAKLGVATVPEFTRLAMRHGVIAA